jgi:hypothetical protein
VSYKEDFPREPAIIKHPNNITEVCISLGSPCNYSTFIDTQSGRVSKKAFFLVLAVEPHRYLVAETGDETVDIYDMFQGDKPLMKIKRDFSSSVCVFTVIEKARFIKGNKLYLKYMSGKDYHDKEEIIDLSVAKIGFFDRLINAMGHFFKTFISMKALMVGEIISLL